MSTFSVLIEALNDHTHTKKKVLIKYHYFEPRDENLTTFLNIKVAKLGIYLQTCLSHTEQKLRSPFVKRVSSPLRWEFWGGGLELLQRKVVEGPIRKLYMQGAWVAQLVKCPTWFWLRSSHLSRVQAPLWALRWHLGGCLGFSPSLSLAAPTLLALFLSLKINKL